jgi:hypothetical protein
LVALTGPAITQEVQASLLRHPATTVGAPVSAAAILSCAQPANDRCSWRKADGAGPGGDVGGFQALRVLDPQGVANRIRASGTQPGVAGSTASSAAPISSCCEFMPSTVFEHTCEHRHGGHIDGSLWMKIRLWNKSALLTGSLG